MKSLSFCYATNFAYKTGRFLSMELWEWGVGLFNYEFARLVRTFFGKYVPVYYSIMLIGSGTHRITSIYVLHLPISI
jgi:hypothetical protein